MEQVLDSYTMPSQPKAFLFEGSYWEPCRELKGACQKQLCYDP